MAIFCSLLLAVVVLELLTFVPHYAESVAQMRRFTHTPLGAALLVGGAILLGLALKFIFVELWSRREERRRRKNDNA